MKKEKIFVLYLIVLLFTLLMVSVLGYFNYKNTSFTGLDKDKIYNEGSKIKYSGLSWYVLENDENYVTLILAGNASTNSFGDTTDFKTSYIYDYLNNIWIFQKENISLKDEISHGALVIDSKTDSYLRLVRIEEIRSDLVIENDSNTPYWTMSIDNDKIMYILENGYTEFTNYKEESSKLGTCYKGSNVSSISKLTKSNKTLILETQKTYALPTQKEVVVSVSTQKVVETCFNSYKIENGAFFENGTTKSYVSSWKIIEETSSIGIRPVIKVKKK